MNSLGASPQRNDYSKGDVIWQTCTTGNNNGLFATDSTKSWRSAGVA